MRDIREIIRDEMVMRSKILKILKDGPKTVPEVAKALGEPTEEVMFWMMGMRKYGYIEETQDITDEGFYRYEITEKGRSENGD